MKKNYGQQGFVILLFATILVMVVEGIGGGEPFWEEPTGMAVLAGADTLPVFHQTVEVSNPVLHGVESWEFLPNEREALSQIQSPYANFFSALDRSKHRKGKTRIAYFGDSMIEGDLITQTLRHEFQQLFGGNGVGFVPITSNTYSFRKSIWHRFSDDWNAFNFLKSSRSDFGISGEIFLARDKEKRESQLVPNWVHYQGSDLFNSTEKFSRASLYYGFPGDSMLLTEPAYVYVKSADRIDTLALNPRFPVNELSLTEEPTSSLELSFSVPANLPIYGVNFGSKDGIHLDNFSSRGSSGRDLVEIPDEILQQFHHHLDYDLIVLHFGVNVTSAYRKNFDSYERAMHRVIEHLRRNIPEADILMVSVGDRGIKLNGQWQTDPSVPLVREAQRRVAEEMGVGFLDLYRSMGGKNTMVRWVARNWAIHDHVHPTRRGAKKLAGIVKDYLLKEYESFSQEIAEQKVPTGNLSTR